jgi:hypothetical protein
MPVSPALLRSVGTCLRLRIEIAWIDLRLLANALERHALLSLAAIRGAASRCPWRRGLKRIHSRPIEIRAARLSTARHDKDIQ